MSKIAEKKAWEAYSTSLDNEPFISKGFVEEKNREGYIKGYDQAMQDFLKKAEEFLYLQLNNGSIECGNIERLIDDFKNYMQDESEN